MGKIILGMGMAGALLIAAVVVKNKKDEISVAKFMAQFKAE